MIQIAKLVLVLLLVATQSLVRCVPASTGQNAIPNTNGQSANGLLDLKNKDMNTLSNELVSILAPNEAKTIAIIMNTLLPSMFGLFSNITSDDFKANFREPCRFDALMDIFKQLPPYFDLIATKYPTKPDLVAYYSMQLASTFLVNNGSLTMACLYNMLSLQTRLMSFSLDIMDNPEKNPQLVGLFGLFMKPVMGMLKKNSMMKIIEHVDRYDKNDDFGNVALFNFLNVVYCFLGVFGIVCNVFLVVLLKRSSSVVAKHRALTLQKINKASAKLVESQKMSHLNNGHYQSNGGQKQLQSSLSGGKAKGQTHPERPELRSKKRVCSLTFHLIEIVKYTSL